MLSASMVATPLPRAGVARWAPPAVGALAAVAAGLALGTDRTALAVAILALAAWVALAAELDVLAAGLVVLTAALPAFSLGPASDLAPNLGLLTLLLAGLVAAAIVGDLAVVGRALTTPRLIIPAAFVAVVLLSGVVGLDPSRSLGIAKTETARLLLLPIAVVIVMMKRDRRQACRLVDRLGLVVLAFGLLGAALSILQVGWGIAYPGGSSEDASLDQFVGSRATGLSEHPNTWAAFLLLALAFCIARWRVYRSGWPIACAALLILSLALTGSRSGWLGLFAMAALTLVWIGGTKRRVAFVVAAVVAVLAAGLFANFREFTLGTSGRNARLSFDDSAHFRAELIRGELRIARLHPLAGVGPGNIAEGLKKLEPGYLERHDLYFVSGAVDKHNTYTGLLAESGVAGLVLFCALFLTAGLSLRRTSRRASTPSEQLAVNGLFAALVAMFVMAAFTDADRQVFLGWILGLAFGLEVLSATAYSQPEPEA
jgi:O-antigen ligase